MLAACSNHVGVVRVLLNAGANMEVREQVCGDVVEVHSFRCVF